MGRSLTFARAEAVPALLHPKRSALCRVGGEHVGAIGELHPDVAEAYGVEGRWVYGELNLGPVHDAIATRATVTAKDLPKYPAVARDIAMLVSTQFQAAEIAEALASASSGLAESVTLFDLYHGASIPEGQRSLAFRIVYRDPEATLTDKRVTQAHAKLGKVAKDKFDATIR